MAKIHGIAGEWARVRGTVIGLWPLFVGVFAAGASLMALFLSVVWGIAALVVSLVYILLMTMLGMRHVERFFIGARGEEKVAGILARLPDSYHVFNDFTVGNKHVDHVVAGPAGVFAVETKFWRGAVTVEDGHILVDGRLPSRPPLDQVMREATLVRNALAELGWSGKVSPVLAFASDTFVAHRATLKGVIVINSNELESAFETQRVILPPAELDRLVSLMENA